MSSEDLKRALSEGKLDFMACTIYVPTREETSKIAVILRGNGHLIRCDEEGNGSLDEWWIKCLHCGKISWERNGIWALRHLGREHGIKPYNGEGE